MLIQFDSDSAARIGRVVRAVEQQYPRARPLTFGRAFDFGPGLDFGEPPDDSSGCCGGRNDSTSFRIATFSGAWNKNVTKIVTLVRDTSATAVTVNLFANIPEPLGNANCAIARDGTAWYLIAAEC